MSITAGATLTGDAGLTGASSLALPSVSMNERQDVACVSGNPASRVYIPARTPEPVWTADRVGDLFAALAIVIGGAFAVAAASLL